MYTIIGGDGREYGPVSPEQIRQWIAAGRANLDTRAKVFGTEDWKQLRDFPEFDPAAAASPPIDPLASVPGGFGALSAAPVQGPFDPFDCFSRSWALLRGNFWQFVGVTLALIGLSVLSMLALIPFLPRLASTPENMAGYFQLPVFRYGFRAISFLVIQPLTAGTFYFFVRKARGEEATLADIFSGFTRAYIAVVLASLVETAFLLCGFICLILPGVYLLVAYMLSHVAIVDRRCGFWTGMELSRRFITRRWWSFFLLLILCALVMFTGALALGIGILVAYPVVLGALAYAYLDLLPPKAAPDQMVQGNASRAEGE